MNKILAVLSVSTCLALQAQNPFKELLTEIEQNNKYLSAFKEQKKEELFLLKAEQSIDNPEVQAYYLPFSNENGSIYREIELSQKLPLPNVYIQQKYLVDQTINTQTIQIKQKRQEVLLQAQKLIIECVFLKRQKDILNTREKLSEKLFSSVETSFINGDASKLDVQKAKLVWLNSIDALSSFELLLKSELNKLFALNGGKKMDIEKIILTNQIVEFGEDSLWQERINSDPEFLYLKQENLRLEKELKVQRSKSLPSLTIGYNRQQTNQETFQGIMAGLSIPLWRNSKLIQAKKLKSLAFNMKSEGNSLKYRNCFKDEYEKYFSLVDRFNKRKKLFFDLKNENLLLESYNLGELSLSEYVLELQFYQTAFDNFLELEKELWLAQAQLLKHRL